MDTNLFEIRSLRRLSLEESCRVTGGSDGWDYDVANAIGRGVGYGVRKICRLFRFLSNNLYDMQETTQVIYK